MNPLVYVVIVNYSGRMHLEYCLPSLLATDYDNYRIVLVDNASTDDSIAYVTANYPEIPILCNDRNRGWAGGNNVGVRYALEQGADYIVLQNNDTRVDPRWLKEAVKVMEARPKLGFLGFHVLGEYRADDDPDGSRFEALMASWNGVELSPAEHISGCALFTRAQVFRDVGLFDETYFVFSEEDDLQKRAMAAGYERLRINVPVWHFHGGTWRRRPLRWSVLAMRNNVRCMFKNDSLPSIVAQLKWLLRFVGSPRITYDPAISHFRRLRPSTWPINNLILAYAFLWNLLFLPLTLHARHRDYRLVMAARARFAAGALPEGGTCCERKEEFHLSR
jgi:GT2 family glycosyltransferase